ncbi:transcription factor Opi1-domain-containing protein [Halteromyces radiatus]|uniref:transcription factor Opi1-domain-containing protein n=1 Tax=Halteromyces radiatus TaxID=101107 RepID=UPI00221E4012|nr:transcription factor Opi1-domain-containing protein [Halteromyces radiatus]KAI8084957.1 transcription factor Opi1-domain-containing protein [Halteromyces radiatus]
MGLIRSFLVSLATSQSSSTTSLSVPTTASPSILSAVKKDVVDTLRKVVDVISRYAGSSLPYHAKVTVRGFILNLPGRWASLNDIRSTTTSPSASPMMSASSPMNTTTTARTINTKEQDVNSPKHEETAIRLLNFGQESVDMLQSISSVFSETVDRAELWLDRLRLRPHENKQDSIINNDHTNRPIQLPPIHTLDPSKNHLNAFDRQSSVTNQFMHSISNEQQQQQQMDLTQ